MSKGIISSVFCFIEFFAFVLSSTEGFSAAQRQVFKSQNSQIIVDIDGNNIKMTVKTVSETKQNVSVFSRSHFDKFCKNDLLPVYFTTESPRHGVLCYRDERNVLSGSEDHPGECAGAVVIFRVLYFQPRRNYVGDDNFTLQILNDGKHVYASADVSVTLRPSSAQPLAGNSSRDDEEQTLGPVPPCAADAF